MTVYQRNVSLIQRNCFLRASYCILLYFPNITINFLLLYFQNLENDLLWSKKLFYTIFCNSLVMWSGSYMAFRRFSSGSSNMGYLSIILVDLCVASSSRHHAGLEAAPPPLPLIPLSLFYFYLFFSLTIRAFRTLSYQWRRSSRELLTILQNLQLFLSSISFFFNLYKYFINWSQMRANVL